ncbi:hypothetical protein EDB84DRAFT_959821 [Lactarius hengduanensis]|nr:hypothetical protein EDB84DRAFT_959821 [Lactarius hengduanensis]
MGWVNMCASTLPCTYVYIRRAAGRGFSAFAHRLPNPNRPIHSGCQAIHRFSFPRTGPWHLNSRSPILTAISRIFRIHSHGTLDSTQNTSFVYIISRWHDSSAISCHNRRETLTSQFYTTLRRSSFRPFPGMNFPSILSNTFLPSQEHFYIAPRTSNSPRTLRACPAAKEGAAEVACDLFRQGGRKRWRATTKELSRVPAERCESGRERSTLVTI